MLSYHNRFLISPMFSLKFSSANGMFWSNFTQISHSSVISWCTSKWHWKWNNWHPGNDYGRMRDKRAKIRDIPSKVRLVATLDQGHQSHLRSQFKQLYYSSHSVSENNQNYLQSTRQQKKNKRETSPAFATSTALSPTILGDGDLTSIQFRVI